VVSLSQHGLEGVHRPERGGKNGTKFGQGIVHGPTLSRRGKTEQSSSWRPIKNGKIRKFLDSHDCISYRHRAVQSDYQGACTLKLWIDADACPRVIKEIVFSASARLNLPVLLVANKSLSKHTSRLVESIVVDNGFDVADDYIAEQAASDDLVITADIPLAARIVAKGAVALDPHGELYTEENVGERLAMRDLMMELRSGGLVQGGPGQFSLTDRQRFASSLDRVLTHLLRRK
jgi:uncharacterized protein YaiI (UPF0178 family)